MEFTTTPYHNNYSRNFHWFVTMHDDDEVIIASAAFDVPADNYEEFDLEIDPAKLGRKLVQTNTLKGTTREFQFYANSHLMLGFVKNKKAEAKKFRVNLACLSSEPVHNKVVVWKWLFSALACAALTTLLVFFIVNETINIKYSYIAGTVTLTASLIFILIFIYQMRNEFIFKSQFGDAKLFLVENKKPDQTKFDSFFIGLQQAIDLAKTKMSVSDRLVGELKMCRRLRDEGIIDDETYTIARTAIFKHEQYKA